MAKELFKEMLDLEGRTVAEEIKPGLVAIRQKSIRTGELKTIYLTVDTIKHLAEVLPDDSKETYAIPGFENLEESMSFMNVRKAA
jgi:hypothetical protein